jgi:thiol:disulfide interchange protein DsbD
LREKIIQLGGERKPVFVDFTAAWRVTCQVSKRVVLEVNRVFTALDGVK